MVYVFCGLLSVVCLFMLNLKKMMHKIFYPILIDTTVKAGSKVHMYLYTDSLNISLDHKYIRTN